MAIDAAGKFKSWIKGKKDTSLSFVLQKMLEQRLEPYGSVQELKLDTVGASLSLQILLKGERDAVTLWVEQYELLSEPSGCSVRVHRARASREWLTLLLRDFVLGRTFPIPEAYASYVKMVL